MKTKINHAGRELGSKKLLAVLAVLAVTLVVLAVVPSAVSGDDQASEVVTPESLGLPAAEDGVVTLHKDLVGIGAVTLDKNVTLKLKTLDLNGFTLEIKSEPESEKFTLMLESTDANSVLLTNKSMTNVSSVGVYGSGLTFEGMKPADGGVGASLIKTNEGAGIYFGIEDSNLTIGTDNNQISTIQTGVCNTVFEFSENSKFTYAGGSVQNTGFVFTASEADMTDSKNGTSVSGYWYLENSTVKAKNVGIYAAKLSNSTFEASGYAVIYTNGAGENGYPPTENPGSAEQKLNKLVLSEVRMYGDSVIKAQEFRNTFPNLPGGNGYFVAAAFNGNPAETEEGTPVYQKVMGNLEFVNAGVVNEKGFEFYNVLFSGTALHVADGVANEVKFLNVKASEYNISPGSIIIGGTVHETTEDDKAYITVISGVAEFSDAIIPKNVIVNVLPGAKLVNPSGNTVRVEGQILIQKGGEMENYGTLDLLDVKCIDFGQGGKPQDMGRFVHVNGSEIIVDGYENAWNNLFFFVDSHYKFKEGFFYKVRMQNFGPKEDAYFGIRDITIQWNGKLIDEQRLKNAGAEVIPLVPKESLRVEAISYSPVLDQDDVVDPGFYADAVRSEVTLTYLGEGGDQPHPQTRSLFVNGDLEITKADFSSELVTIEPGENPTYDSTDLKNKFTFDVSYTINGDDPIPIPPSWYKPIFNVKNEEGELVPVGVVIDAGKYYVQLEATPDNEIFQGMSKPVEVMVLKATSSIMLEDTTNGKFWNAMDYKPGLIKITPKPLTVPITATATIEGQNPIVAEIGENQSGSAQENLDAMLNDASLNHKAGVKFTLKVQIIGADNIDGSEAEMPITVGVFKKLTDYLGVEADNVSSKTNVTVEVDSEDHFKYNASGPVERDSQTGGYTFFLKVMSKSDLALIGQTGENGLGVEFKGSDGVEVEDLSTTSDGKCVELRVTIGTLPRDGTITIAATPTVENLSLEPATYIVDLSGLYPAELRIVFHDEYNTMTFTENLIAYAYILDKLQKIKDVPGLVEDAKMLRDFLQFEIGDYFLLPAPSDGKQWKLSYIGSDDEPVDEYYSGNSIYVIKEEHIDATNAIHFWAANAPDAPQPGTGNVVFVFGDEVEIRTMEFGTLSIPDDIAEAAAKPGFKCVWKYNGIEISDETQVIDGMILIAEYTQEPATTGDVTFVYGTNAVTRSIEFGTLVVPEDVDAAAKKDGCTHIWTYNGVEISDDTMVIDGMVVVAVYTAIPVDPTTGNVTFGFGGISITRALEFGTLVVPADINAAAKKDGYTHIWTYNGVEISDETQVKDGMIVIAEYTAIPVDPTTGKVIFVFGGVGVTKTMNLGTLEVPEDVDAAAKKDGYTHIWTYNGVEISDDTMVIDGMVVVAVYTPIYVEPTTGDVTFVYDGNAVVKTLDLGTLVVPQDVNDAAQKEGYDLEWMYNGNVISGQTQVTDGMVVVAVYTPIPVVPTTGDVTFVYDGTAVEKTLDLGTLVVPQDVNDAAQKEGYDLTWKYKGEEINAETQVEDGMVVVAVYTETPVPVEYSTNMVVAIKIVDGKIFYTIVALDGKAVPAGTLRIGYAYAVDLGDWGTTIDFDKVDVGIINGNGSEFIRESIDLPEVALTVYAEFTYDGGSESTPTYIIANEATQ